LQDFVGFRLDFAGIRQGIAGITIEVRWNHCLRGILEKKGQKWSRMTHVTTVPSVNDGLTNGVPELRDFKTLGGQL
jgi:hypothetical protein